MERTIVVQRLTVLQPHNLKSNQERIRSRDNHCIKFGNVQANGSKDIMRTRFGLHIN